MGATIELVIINNNSADATDSVCEHFAACTRIPFRWFNETRQGLSHARNRGMEEATGSIVIFTDDDITVPSNWISEYARVFREHEADCVFGGIIPDWNGEKPSWYDSKFDHIFGALDYGPDQFVVTTRNFEFFGANFACRKSLLQQMGGFDPSLGRTPDALYISEERKIFLHLFNRGARIIYSPTIFVHHHVSPEMKTKSYIRRYYRDTATSLVNITEINPHRQLLGIPFYRLHEAGLFLLLLLPRMVICGVTGRFQRAFALRLECQRMLRVLILHIKRYFVRI
jgi:glycosyltransferase involved in cell wall biosynthesis